MRLPASQVAQTATPTEVPGDQRPRWTRLLLLMLAVSLSLAAGCQSGEGGPCQLDFDCEDGLECSGTPRGVCRAPSDDDDDADAEADADVGTGAVAGAGGS